MKFFNNNPVAPGRDAIVPVHSSTTAHVKSDDASYVAAQIAQVVAGLKPFTPEPQCLKCASIAIATEHGSGYYVPYHPDREQVEDKYSGFGMFYITPAPGSYHTGPEYLVRSCTVCKHAWAERTADAALPSPSTLER